MKRCAQYNDQQKSRKICIWVQFKYKNINGRYYVQSILSILLLLYAQLVVSAQAFQLMTIRQINTQIMINKIILSQAMFSSMKLAPTTLMGKDESKKIKTIIQSILDKPESYDFQSPVDWKALGLSDYTFIIKKPMDLGTVGQNLRNQKYRFVEEALDDIQLVWDNCRAYNPEETWIYKTAENLERMYKKMVKNYLPNIPIVVPGRQNTTRNEQKKPMQSNLFEEDSEEEVPYHDKMRLQEKLKHLAAEDLGQVVDFIMRNCPEAFLQEDNDNAQLILDNLDGATFQQVTEMLQRLNQEYQQKATKKVKL